MRYIVSVITAKGRSMVGINEDPLSHPHPAPPLVNRASSNARWVLGTLLFIIAVSAIIGIVVAAVSGQTTVALIIALFAGAFFSRVGC
jgi:1,4-dihydroxy-2-naphthoate octaprenyltransferase